MESHVWFYYTSQFFPPLCFLLSFLGINEALCIIWLHSLYAHGWNGIQCCVSCCKEVVLILAHLDGVKPVTDRDEQRVVWHVLWGIGETEMTRRKIRDWRGSTPFSGIVSKHASDFAQQSHSLCYAITNYFPTCIEKTVAFYCVRPTKKIKCEQM